MSGNSGGEGSHTHSGSTTPISTAHTHTGSVGADGSHNHNYRQPDTDATPKQPGKGPKANKGFQTEETGKAGNHSHTLTINPGGGSHTHTVTIDPAQNHTHSTPVSGANHSHTGSVTGNGSHSHGTSPSGISGTYRNIPPYYALYYVMRIL